MPPKIVKREAVGYYTKLKNDKKILIDCNSFDKQQLPVQAFRLKQQTNRSVTSLKTATVGFQADGQRSDIHK